MDWIRKEKVGRGEKARIELQKKYCCSSFSEQDLYTVWLPRVVFIISGLFFFLLFFPFPPFFSLSLFSSFSSSFFLLFLNFLRLCRGLGTDRLGLSSAQLLIICAATENKSSLVQCFYRLRWKIGSCKLKSCWIVAFVSGKDLWRYK